jgi:amidohydrolase
MALHFPGEGGRKLLFRCELDAVAIEETEKGGYTSARPGVAHACGHDGHMAIMAGFALRLAGQKERKHDIALLFQPAEETGQGAAAVIGSGFLSTFPPDYFFALHNLPGFPKDAVVIREGPFAMASTGLTFEFFGKPSHAAHPESGISPAGVISRLMSEVSQPSFTAELGMVTIVHASLGEPLFGLSPGSGVLMMTLRSLTDETLHRLCEKIEGLALQLSMQQKLVLRSGHCDVFSATVNDPDATSVVVKAAEQLALKIVQPQVAFRWSEDFGRYGQLGRTALFGLGAGEQQPDLHTAGYDFPDDLIGKGMMMFDSICNQIPT